MATLDLSRMATAHMARFGEPCAYSSHGAAQGTPGLCIVAPTGSQIWSGGLIQVTEEHTIGYFLPSSGEPEEKGVLSFSDGRRYIVDQPPWLDRGVWVLVLRESNA